jgi:FAD:protein FMN transferase
MKLLKTIQNEFKALGTDIGTKIVLSGNHESDVAKKVLDELKLFYFEKEKIFSRFDENSELSGLNEKLGEYSEASRDIIEIAEKSLYYNQLTGGFFDPRIIGALEGVGYDRDFGKIKKTEAKISQEEFSKDLEEDLKIEKNKVKFNCRMDFSGIAKGYITDRASEFLKNKGFGNFLVDSGGDIYASGTDENDEPWNISIEGTDENKLSFGLSDRGIATSGITRRKWEISGKKYHHLINPKNPQEFLFDLKTVTVISENTEKADVWAKILYLMGKERGIIFSNENDIASAFLDYRGNVCLSQAVKKYT